MRRLFFQMCYPFAVIANKIGWLNYKWVNVSRSAWYSWKYPAAGDKLWHHTWFGDTIDNIPKEVNLCGILFTTKVIAEGMIIFSSRDTLEQISFERDPYDKYASLWYIEKNGHVPAIHVVEAYRWVEAVCTETGCGNDI